MLSDESIHPKKRHHNIQDISTLNLSSNPQLSKEFFFFVKPTELKQNSVDINTISTKVDGKRICLKNTKPIENYVLDNLNCDNNLRKIYIPSENLVKREIIKYSNSTFNNNGILSYDYNNLSSSRYLNDDSKTFTSFLRDSSFKNLTHNKNSTENINYKKTLVSSPESKNRYTPINIMHESPLTRVYDISPLTSEYISKNILPDFKNRINHYYKNTPEQYSVYNKKIYDLDDSYSPNFLQFDHFNNQNTRNFITPKQFKLSNSTPFDQANNLNDIFPRRIYPPVQNIHNISESIYQSPKKQRYNYFSYNNLNYKNHIHESSDFWLTCKDLYDNLNTLQNSKGNTNINHRRITSDICSPIIRSPLAGAYRFDCNIYNESEIKLSKISIHSNIASFIPQENHLKNLSNPSDGLRIVIIGSLIDSTFSVAKNILLLAHKLNPNSILIAPDTKSEEPSLSTPYLFKNAGYPEKKITKVELEMLFKEYINKRERIHLKRNYNKISTSIPNKKMDEIYSNSPQYINKLSEENLKIYNVTEKIKNSSLQYSSGENLNICHLDETIFNKNKKILDSFIVGDTKKQSMMNNLPIESNKQEKYTYSNDSQLLQTKNAKDWEIFDNKSSNFYLNEKVQNNISDISEPKYISINKVLNKNNIFDKKNVVQKFNFKKNLKSPIKEYDVEESIPKSESQIKLELLSKEYEIKESNQYNMKESYFLSNLLNSKNHSIDQDNNLENSLLKEYVKDISLDVNTNFRQKSEQDLQNKIFPENSRYFNDFEEKLMLEKNRIKKMSQNLINRPQLSIRAKPKFYDKIKLKSVKKSSTLKNKNIKYINTSYNETAYNKIYIDPLNKKILIPKRYQSCSKMQNNKNDIDYKKDKRSETHIVENKSLRFNKNLSDKNKIYKRSRSAYISKNYFTNITNNILVYPDKLMIRIKSHMKSNIKNESSIEKTDYKLNRDTIIIDNISKDSPYHLQYNTIDPKKDYITSKKFNNFINLESSILEKKTNNIETLNNEINSNIILEEYNLLNRKSILNEKLQQKDSMFLNKYSLINYPSSISSSVRNDEDISTKYILPEYKYFQDLENKQCIKRPTLIDLFNTPNEAERTTRKENIRFASTSNLYTTPINSNLDKKSFEKYMSYNLNSVSSIDNSDIANSISDLEYSKPFLKYTSTNNFNNINNHIVKIPSMKYEPGTSISDSNPWFWLFHIMGSDSFDEIISVLLNEIEPRITPQFNSEYFSNLSLNHWKKIIKDGISNNKSTPSSNSSDTDTYTKESLSSSSKYTESHDLIYKINSKDSHKDLVNKSNSTDFSNDSLLTDSQNSLYLNSYNDLLTNRESNLFKTDSEVLPMESMTTDNILNHLMIYKNSNIFSKSITDINSFESSTRKSKSVPNIRIPLLDTNFENNDLSSINFSSRSSLNTISKSKHINNDSLKQKFNDESNNSSYNSSSFYLANSSRNYKNKYNTINLSNIPISKISKNKKSIRNSTKKKIPESLMEKFYTPLNSKTKRISTDIKDSIYYLKNGSIASKYDKQYFKKFIQSNINLTNYDISTNYNDQSNKDLFKDQYFNFLENYNINENNFPEIEDFAVSNFLQSLYKSYPKNDNFIFSEKSEINNTHDVIYAVLYNLLTAIKKKMLYNKNHNFTIGYTISPVGREKIKPYLSIKNGYSIAIYCITDLNYDISDKKDILEVPAYNTSLISKSILFYMRQNLEELKICLPEWIDLIILPTEDWVDVTLGPRFFIKNTPVFTLGQNSSSDSGSIVIELDENGLSIVTIPSCLGETLITAEIPVQNGSSCIINKGRNTLEKCIFIAQSERNNCLLYLNKNLLPNSISDQIRFASEDNSQLEISEELYNDNKTNSTVRILLDEIPQDKSYKWDSTRVEILNSLGLPRSATIKDTIYRMNNDDIGYNFAFRLCSELEPTDGSRKAISGILNELTDEKVSELKDESINYIAKKNNIPINNGILNDTIKDKFLYFSRNTINEVINSCSEELLKLLHSWDITSAGNIQLAHSLALAGALAVDNSCGNLNWSASSYKSSFISVPLVRILKQSINEKKPIQSAEGRQCITVPLIALSDNITKSIEDKPNLSYLFSVIKESLFLPAEISRNLEDLHHKDYPDENPYGSIWIGNPKEYTENIKHIGDKMTDSIPRVDIPKKKKTKSNILNDSLLYDEYIKEYEDKTDNPETIQYISKIQNLKDDLVSEEYESPIKLLGKKRLNGNLNEINKRIKFAEINTYSPMKKVKKLKKLKTYKHTVKKMIPCSYVREYTIKNCSEVISTTSNNIKQLIQDHLTIYNDNKNISNDHIYTYRKYTYLSKKTFRSMTFKSRSKNKLKRYYISVNPRIKSNFNSISGEFYSSKYISSDLKTFKFIDTPITEFKNPKYFSIQQNRSENKTVYLNNKLNQKFNLKEKLNFALDSSMCNSLNNTKNLTNINQQNNNTLYLYSSNNKETTDLNLFPIISSNNCLKNLTEKTLTNLNEILANDKHNLSDCTENIPELSTSKQNFNSITKNNFSSSPYISHLIWTITLASEGIDLNEDIPEHWRNFVQAMNFSTFIDKIYNFLDSNVLSKRLTVFNKRFKQNKTIQPTQYSDIHVDNFYENKTIKNQLSVNSSMNKHFASDNMSKIHLNCNKKLNKSINDKMFQRSYLKSLKVIRNVFNFCDISVDQKSSNIMCKDKSNKKIETQSKYCTSNTKEKNESINRIILSQNHVSDNLNVNKYTHNLPGITPQLIKQVENIAHNLDIQNKIRKEKKSADAVLLKLQKNLQLPDDITYIKDPASRTAKTYFKKFHLTKSEQRKRLQHVIQFCQSEKLFRLVSDLKESKDISRADMLGSNNHKIETIVNQLLNDLLNSIKHIIHNGDENSLNEKNTNEKIISLLGKLQDFSSNDNEDLNIINILKECNDMAESDIQYIKQKAVIREYAGFLDSPYTNSEACIILQNHVNISEFSSGYNLCFSQLQNNPVPIWDINSPSDLKSLEISERTGEYNINEYTQKIINSSLLESVSNTYFKQRRGPSRSNKWILEQLRAIYNFPSSNENIKKSALNVIKVLNKPKVILAKTDEKNHYSNLLDITPVENKNTDFKIIHPHNKYDQLNLDLQSYKNIELLNEDNKDISSTVNVRFTNLENDTMESRTISFKDEVKYIDPTSTNKNNICDLQYEDTHINFDPMIFLSRAPRLYHFGKLFHTKNQNISLQSALNTINLIQNCDIDKNHFLGSISNEQKKSSDFNNKSKHLYNDLERNNINNSFNNKEFNVGNFADLDIINNKFSSTKIFSNKNVQSAEDKFTDKIENNQVSHSYLVTNSKKTINRNKTKKSYIRNEINLKYNLKNSKSIILSKKNSNQSRVIIRNDKYNKKKKLSKQIYKNNCQYSLFLKNNLPIKILKSQLSLIKENTFGYYADSIKNKTENETNYEDLNFSILDIEEQIENHNSYKDYYKLNLSIGDFGISHKTEKKQKYIKDNAKYKNTLKKSKQNINKNLKNKLLETLPFPGLLYTLKNSDLPSLAEHSKKLYEKFWVTAYPDIAYQSNILNINLSTSYNTNNLGEKWLLDELQRLPSTHMRRAPKETLQGILECLGAKKYVHEDLKKAAIANFQLDSVLIKSYDSSFSKKQNENKVKKKTNSVLFQNYDEETYLDIVEIWNKSRDMIFDLYNSYKLKKSYLQNYHNVTRTLNIDEIINRLYPNDIINSNMDYLKSYSYINEDRIYDKLGYKSVNNKSNIINQFKHNMSKNNSNTIFDSRTVITTDKPESKNNNSLKYISRECSQSCSNSNLKEYISLKNNIPNQDFSKSINISNHTDLLTPTLTQRSEEIVYITENNKFDCPNDLDSIKLKMNIYPFSKSSIKNTNTNSRYRSVSTKLQPDRNINLSYRKSFSKKSKSLIVKKKYISNSTKQNILLQNKSKPKYYISGFSLKPLEKSDKIYNLRGYEKKDHNMNIGKLQKANDFDLHKYSHDNHDKRDQIMIQNILNYYQDLVSLYFILRIFHSLLTILHEHSELFGYTTINLKNNSEIEKELYNLLTNTNTIIKNTKYSNNNYINNHENYTFSENLNLINEKFTLKDYELVLQEIKRFSDISKNLENKKENISQSKEISNKLRCNETICLAEIAMNKYPNLFFCPVKFSWIHLIVDQKRSIINTNNYFSKKASAAASSILTTANHIFSIILLVSLGENIVVKSLIEELPNTLQHILGIEAILSLSYIENGITTLTFFAGILIESIQSMNQNANFLNDYYTFIRRYDKDNQSTMLNNKNVNSESDFEDDKNNESDFNENKNNKSDFEDDKNNESYFKENINNKSDFKENKNNNFYFKGNKNNKSDFKENKNNKSDFEENKNNESDFEENKNNESDFEENKNNESSSENVSLISNSFKSGNRNTYKSINKDHLKISENIRYLTNQKKNNSIDQNNLFFSQSTCDITNNIELPFYNSPINLNSTESTHIGKMSDKTTEYIQSNRQIEKKLSEQNLYLNNINDTMNYTSLQDEINDESNIGMLQKIGIPMSYSNGKILGHCGPFICDISIIANLYILLLESGNESALNILYQSAYISTIAILEILLKSARIILQSDIDNVSDIDESSAISSQSSDSSDFPRKSDSSISSELTESSISEQTPNTSKSLLPSLSSISSQSISNVSILGVDQPIKSVISSEGDTFSSPNMIQRKVGVTNKQKSKEIYRSLDKTEITANGLSRNSNCSKLKLIFCQDIKSTEQYYRSKNVYSSRLYINTKPYNTKLPIKINDFYSISIFKYYNKILRYNLLTNESITNKNNLGYIIFNQDKNLNSLKSLISLGFVKDFNFYNNEIKSRKNKLKRFTRELNIISDSYLKRDNESQPYKFVSKNDYFKNPSILGLKTHLNINTHRTSIKYTSNINKCLIFANSSQQSNIVSKTSEKKINEFDTVKIMTIAIIGLLKNNAKLFYPASSTCYELINKSLIAIITNNMLPLVYIGKENSYITEEYNYLKLSIDNDFIERFLNNLSKQAINKFLPSGSRENFKLYSPERDFLNTKKTVQLEKVSSQQWLQEVDTSNKINTVYNTNQLNSNYGNVYNPYSNYEENSFSPNNSFDIYNLNNKILKKADEKSYNKEKNNVSKDQYLNSNSLDMIPCKSMLKCSKSVNITDSPNFKILKKEEGFCNSKLDISQESESINNIYNITTNEDHVPLNLCKELLKELCFEWSDWDLLKYGSSDITNIDETKNDEQIFADSDKNKFRYKSFKNSILIRSHTNMNHSQNSQEREKVISLYNLKKYKRNNIIYNTFSKQNSYSNLRYYRKIYKRFYLDSMDLLFQEKNQEFNKKFFILSQPKMNSCKTYISDSRIYSNALKQKLNFHQYLTETETKKENINSINIEKHRIKRPKPIYQFGYFAEAKTNINSPNINKYPNIDRYNKKTHSVPSNLSKYKANSISILSRNNKSLSNSDKPKRESIFVDRLNYVLNQKNKSLEYKDKFILNMKRPMRKKNSFNSLSKENKTRKFITGHSSLSKFDISNRGSSNYTKVFKKKANTIKTQGSKNIKYNIESIRKRVLQPDPSTYKGKYEINSNVETNSLGDINELHRNYKSIIANKYKADGNLLSNPKTDIDSLILTTSKNISGEKKSQKELFLYNNDKKIDYKSIYEQKLNQTLDKDSKKYNINVDEITNNNVINDSELENAVDLLINQTYNNIFLDLTDEAENLRSIRDTSNFNRTLDKEENQLNNVSTEYPDCSLSSLDTISSKIYDNYKSGGKNENFEIDEKDSNDSESFQDDRDTSDIEWADSIDSAIKRQFTVYGTLVQVCSKMKEEFDQNTKTKSLAEALDLLNEEVQLCQLKKPLRSKLIRQNEEKYIDNRNYLLNPNTIKFSEENLDKYTLNLKHTEINNKFSTSYLNNSSDMCKINSKNCQFNILVDNLKIIRYFNTNRSPYTMKLYNNKLFKNMILQKLNINPISTKDIMILSETDRSSQKYRNSFQNLENYSVQFASSENNLTGLTIFNEEISQSYAKEPQIYESFNRDLLCTNYNYTDHTTKQLPVLKKPIQSAPLNVVTPNSKFYSTLKYNDIEKPTIEYFPTEKSTYDFSYIINEKENNLNEYTENCINFEKCPKEFKQLNYNKSSQPKDENIIKIYQPYTSSKNKSINKIAKHSFQEKKTYKDNDNEVYREYPHNEIFNLKEERQNLSKLLCNVTNTTEKYSFFSSNIVDDYCSDNSDNKQIEYINNFLSMTSNKSTNYATRETPIHFDISNLINRDPLTPISLFTIEYKNIDNNSYDSERKNSIVERIEGLLYLNSQLFGDISFQEFLIDRGIIELGGHPKKKSNSNEKASLSIWLRAFQQSNKRYQFTSCLWKSLFNFELPITTLPTIIFNKIATYAQEHLRLFETQNLLHQSNNQLNFEYHSSYRDIFPTTNSDSKISPEVFFANRSDLHSLNRYSSLHKIYKPKIRKTGRNFLIKLHKINLKNRLPCFASGEKNIKSEKTNLKKNNSINLYASAHPSEISKIAWDTATTVEHFMRVLFLNDYYRNFENMKVPHWLFYKKISDFTISQLRNNTKFNELPNNKIDNRLIQREIMSKFTKPIKETEVLKENNILLEEESMNHINKDDLNNYSSIKNNSFEKNIVDTSYNSEKSNSESTTKLLNQRNNWKASLMKNNYISPWQNTLLYNLDLNYNTDNLEKISDTIYSYIKSDDQKIREAYANQQLIKLSEELKENHKINTPFDSDSLSFICSEQKKKL